MKNMKEQIEQHKETPEKYIKLAEDLVKELKRDYAYPPTISSLLGRLNRLDEFYSEIVNQELKEEGYLDGKGNQINQREISPAE